MKKIRQILMLLMCIVSALLNGCQKSTPISSEQITVSIDGQAIYLDEMIYHIMIAEFQGKLIGSYLGNEANYWNSEYEKGITMSEAMKDKVMNDAIKYEIFYRKAIEAGMVLNNEEKAVAKETVSNLMHNMPDEMLELAQLDEEDLVRIEEKIALATKGYQNFVKSLKADEASIKSQINPDDYVEYKIQYLFIPTMKKDLSGKLISLAQEEKQEAYEIIHAYEETAQGISNLTSIETKSEEGIRVGEVSFTEKNNSFAEEIEIIDVTKQLGEKEVSRVFETSRGYYIIKRLKGNSTALYNDAIKKATKEIEESRVLPAYEELKKSYKIKINKRVWGKVKIGQMTIR